MSFTRQEYIDDYKEIYKNLKEGGSGGAEYKRSQEYYDLPKKCGWTEEHSLLDYGCGWGALLAGIKPKDYYGVDIVPEAIELCRKHFPNNKFDVLEIGKLNCEKMDYAVALSVFTHTINEDIDACLQDIHRNTRYGALIDFLEGDNEKSNLHIRYHSKDFFLKKLKDNGFEVIDEFSIKAQYGYVHTYFITKIV